MLRDVTWEVQSGKPRSTTAITSQPPPATAAKQEELVPSARAARNCSPHSRREHWNDTRTGRFRRLEQCSTLFSHWSKLVFCRLWATASFVEWSSPGSNGCRPTLTHGNPAPWQRRTKPCAEGASSSMCHTPHLDMRRRPRTATQAALLSQAPRIPWR